MNIKDLNISRRKVKSKLGINLLGYRVITFLDNPVFLIQVLVILLVVQAFGGMPVFAELFTAKATNILKTAGVANAAMIAATAGLLLGFFGVLLVESLAAIAKWYNEHKVSKRLMIAIFFIGWLGYMNGISLPNTFYSPDTGFNLLAAGLGKYITSVLLTGLLSFCCAFGIHFCTARLKEHYSNELFKAFRSAQAEKEADEIAEYKSNVAVKRSKIQSSIVNNQTKQTKETVKQAATKSEDNRIRAELRIAN